MDTLIQHAEQLAMFGTMIYLLIRLVPIMENANKTMKEVKTLAQVLVYKMTGEPPSEVKK